LFINPKSVWNLQGTVRKGISVPSYGNYGGPTISGPERPVDALFQQRDFNIHQKIIEDTVVKPEELVHVHTANVCKARCGVDTCIGTRRTR
jgi:hypothetical protein